MNDSGDSAGPARGSLKVPLDRVIVLHDEIDLPFGEIRVPPRRRPGRPQRPQEPQTRLRRRRVLARPGRGRAARLDRSRDRLRLRARRASASRRPEVEALVASAADETERLVEQLGSEPNELMTDRADQLRGRRERGRAAAPRTRRSRATRSTPRCWSSCSSTSRSPAATTRSACSSSAPPTTSASPPAPTSARSSTSEGKVRRMQLFADLYDEHRRLPEADDRGLPRRRRRRRRRDRDRLRHAGRRLQPADALPRRGARRPGRPRPPGHPLRPRRRQVPAALLAHGRRRRGAAARPRQPRRPRRRDRGLGAGAGGDRRRPPARGGRPAEADAARVGRRRGPLGAEGVGQVEWAAHRARVYRS